jgi:hypothetical protein
MQKSSLIERTRVAILAYQVRLRQREQAKQFETRSKETVLADLTEKLRGLPIDHPDRSALARMICDLGREFDGRSIAVPAAAHGFKQR